MRDERKSKKQILEEFAAYRKQAVLALDENVARYKSLFEYSPDAIYSFDRDGHFTSANDTASRFSGYSVQELLNRMFETIIVPEDLEKTRQHFLKAREGEPQNYETRIVRKDGEVILLNVTNIPIIIRKKVTGVYGIAQDITARKRTEEAIRDSEEKYRTLIESTLDFVFTSDRKGMFTYINPRFEMVTGRTASELLGQPFTDVIAPEARNMATTQFKKGIRGEKGAPYEIDIIHKSGNRIPVEFNVTTLRDGNGQPIGRYGIGRDLTERKRTELALRESEDMLYSTVQGSSISTFVIGKDHRVVYWNRALEELSQIRAAEVIGTSGHWRAFYSEERPCMADLLVDEDFDRIPEWYAGRCKKSDLLEEAYEALDFFPDLGNGGKWLRFTAAAIRNTQGDLIGAVETLEDITEHTQAGDQLRESQRRLSDIIEFLPDATLVIDKNGKVIAWNRAIEAMTGVKAEDMLSKGDYEYALPFYGERRPILIDLALSADTEREKQYTAIRRTGDILFGEAYTPNLAPGNVHLSATASVLRDSGGDIIAAIECIRNNTERKILEAQLQQAQKMEAIGTLAGGIAHDFNNLLMAIQGNISLMMMNTNPSDPRYEKLRSIEDQVVTGANLTKQLLGFARVGKYELKPIDLNEVIEKSSTMFGRTKKEILIHKKYEQALWAVEADASQMEQVIMNLYVNAWQAMPGGGHLYLETANLTVTEIKVKSSFMKPGSYVKVSVTDTGVGMDEKTKERIFEPFFTTKELGRGTGLGLAMVYGIIKGHNGYINVYSEKDKGTIFNIYLPASKKEALKKDKPEEIILKGQESILLVDDEGTIIKVIKEILEALGYHVLTAGNGREALEIYEENKNKIDLVILDMIMPDMSGGETFEHLKEINPDIKVILSSGYSLNGEAAGIMARGCQGFIQKPAGLAILSQKIREVLGSKA